MNAKKRALGKGLSALLDNAGAEAQPMYDAEKDLLPVGTIGKVPLDMIESNPFQPRTDFDEEALKELAASIKEQGVIQPVTVRKSDNGQLQLIAGERRFKASRMAGLSDIPAYIITATDHSMLEMAIVENIQREDLNPVEIALGYKQLMQEYNLTQEMLSERLGKSRSSIANYLRLLNLPSEIQLGLRQDLISAGHARGLLAIGDLQTQLEVYQDIIADGLSVRDVEGIVKNLSTPDEEEDVKAPEKGKPEGGPYPEKELQLAEKDLAYLYDSKVKLKVRSNGKGSIVIGFSSRDDLERILGLLKK
jgi:ParB family transcriptional regulator, chromosome partitioning protein